MSLDLALAVELFLDGFGTRIPPASVDGLNHREDTRHRNHYELDDQHPDRHPDAHVTRSLASPDPVIPGFIVRVHGAAANRVMAR
jgi:hypothetical protein